jgi:hypothetical protein
MKRTKKVKREELPEENLPEEHLLDEKEEPSIMYRKVGSGTFRTKQGKIIKPNQKFMAKPSDIPEVFKDVIVPLDDLPDEQVHPETIGPKYEVVSKGAGWYDVINSVTGKVVNEKGLRQADAKKLIEDLS